jgi:multidrug efflux system membrane fusion protein
MDAMTTEPVRTRKRSLLGRAFGALLILLALAAIGWAVLFFPKAEPPTKGRDLAGLPVPVVTAAAEAKDVPIYLDGLGTIQAFNSVTMKAMVDGPLIAVNFKEGQDVRKGDILAQIDSRTYKATLDSALAKKAQDEAQLANARLDLIRQQKLVASNYTSAQQADTARATVAQYEALVAQDQAQVDNARTQLGYTAITAPMDGLAGIRLVDQGNIVHAGDATGIVVITQIQPVSVVFTLPQQELPAVARAMAAGPVTVLALAQDVGGARALDTGTLAALDNQVDATTGTIKLKATFPNAQRRLWPGGFVRVRLQSRVAAAAVTVPPSAIQRGPRGPYVFTIADGLAKRVPVVTGYEDATASIVTEGLKGGEQVVTDGASRLSDGSKVVVARPDGAAPPQGPAQGPERANAPGTRRPQPPPQ